MKLIKTNKKVNKINQNRLQDEDQPIYNYKNIKKIGSGTFSKVFKSKNSSGKFVAVKKYKSVSGKLYTGGIDENIIREIAVLKTCNHPNVIRILDVDLIDFKCVVMEYYNYCLSDIVTDKKWKLDKENIQSIFGQLLLGLDYLHKLNIIHRDIKDDNILISYTIEYGYKAVIADLGSGRMFHEGGDKTPKVITLYERAPEVMLNTEKAIYGTSVDIWSLGCVLSYTIIRSHLFTGNSEIEMLTNIFKIMGNPIDMVQPDKYFLLIDENIKPTFDEIFKGYDKNLVNLISKMLRLEPEVRIDAETALRHPYFEEMYSTDIVQDNWKCETNMNIEIPNKYIKNRHKILSWLNGYVFKYINIVQYLTTINILDRYITYHDDLKLNNIQWHTLGISAFWISSKLEALEPYDVDSLSDISDYMLEENEICSLEKHILKTLKGDLYNPLMTDFIADLDSIYLLDTEQLNIRNSLLIYISFDINLINNFHPKTLTEAIYLLASGNTEEQDPVLSKCLKLLTKWWKKQHNSLKI